MNASTRDVVELASSDYELTDVSDRLTPCLPSEPFAGARLVDTVDFDTTQVVPKLVLSELRHQASLRSTAGTPALTPSVASVASVAMNGVAATAPTLRPSNNALVDAPAAVGAQEDGTWRSVIVGGLVATCLLSVALIALVH